jgi:hypothetical protein
MSPRRLAFAALFASLHLVVLTTLRAASSDRLLLDNELSPDSPHVFTATGSWITQSVPAGFHGNDFLLAPAGAENTSAQWRPNITTAGYYRIYARWAAAPERARRAALEISYDGGEKIDTTRSLNQTVNGGVWVQIGTYFLAAGTGNSVRLRASADGTVAADAILFELSHATTESPTDDASVTPRIEYANADWRLNPREVELVRTDSAAADATPAFELRVHGVPFEVRGACGHEAVAPIAAAGGNTIRIYSVNPLGNVEDYLKAASNAGIKVMLGLYLTPADPGSNANFYEDPAKVEAQFNAFKTQIDAYKHCEAILAWCIGNEIDPADHANPGPIYRAIDQIARYIQDTDHYHPTVTSHAGSHQSKISGVKMWAPNIDIIGINSYERTIGNVHPNVLAAGWTGPYLITEFSIEQPQQRSAAEGNVTIFGSIIEPTSAEKFARLPVIYLNHILAHPDRCLGSFAFKGALGAFRITHTWYPLLDENLKPTPSYDAMRLAWGGPVTAFTAPRVTSITINGQPASTNVQVGEAFTSAVTVEADAGAELHYLVEVRPDVGLSINTPPSPLPELVATPDPGDPRRFTVSLQGMQPGELYRLYYYVRQLDPLAPFGYNAVGTANIPFRVLTGPGLVAQYAFAASSFANSATSSIATAGALDHPAGGSVSSTTRSYFKTNANNAIPETLDAALAGNHYLGFTVTPGAGPVDFQMLSFAFGGSNSTATVENYTGSWALLSNATGFTATAVLATGEFSVVANSSTTPRWHPSPPNVNLANFPSLLAVTAPVEFRLYFWDNSVEANNGLIVRFDSIELTARATAPQSGFAAWRAATFTPDELAQPAISAAGADPDSDGLTNLLEYAFATPPLLANSVS